MKKYTFILVACLWGSCSPEPLSENALEELVAAERGFAEAAAAEGMQAAFLAHLAEDAIIFRPTPVNGPTWFAEQPPAPGLLAWEPVFADIARSGDFGYTTGPWSYRDADAEPQYGHYVSVWRKTLDGSWRVALDVGIDHPAPPEAPLALTSPPKADTHSSWEAANLEAERTALLQADRALTETNATSSAEALLARAADDVWVFRPGSLPAVGLPDARGLLAHTDSARSWQPSGAALAQSGDLGYSYGLTYPTAGGTADTTQALGTYLHIWKRQAEGPWQIVLDLENPLPPFLFVERRADSVERKGYANAENQGSG